MQYLDGSCLPISLLVLGELVGVTGGGGAGGGGDKSWGRVFRHDGQNGRMAGGHFLPQALTSTCLIDDVICNLHTYFDIDAHLLLP
jgi:uncharacterized protein YgfB (UPF0149 family)